ncbi:MAG: tryptophan-rich sensory protein [Rhodospirillaceae bacterium]|nr:tryptophan-rich sensory protein [Rhodospirillaceae bacterium]
MRPRFYVMRDILALIGFLAACFAVSGLGAFATAGSVGAWYQTLAKPSFNPPDWVFGPVWTALYILIAVAGWRVWRKMGFSDHKAFAAYGGQLALNLLWSVLFFGIQQPAVAMIDLIVLWIAIAANMILFARHDRTAALLLAPYILWVGFAGVLNAAIVVLN